VMAQGPLSGQVRVPLPKTHHEDAEVMEAERRTLPSEVDAQIGERGSLLRAAAIASLVPRARSAKTLAYFRFDELLATLMVNIWPRAPWQERGRSVSVKGFRTPASHGRVGMHGGRRPKSLEGGNRGEFAPAVVSVYGDLAPVHALIFRFRTGTTGE